MTKPRNQPRRQTPAKRAANNRRERQDALREELKAREYLRQIQDDYEKLQVLINKIKTLKAEKLLVKMAVKLNRLADYSKARFELEKCMSQKEILRIKFDTNFRRLKFCLPELRSIELTDPSGESLFSKFIEAVENNLGPES